MGVVSLEVNGASVEVDDDASSLLEVLREQLGLVAAKDGCSPQGQCGCCTVWVDGAPRVACVTPVRRVAGRAVTTPEGLPPATARRFAAAFVARGASQCGFCTPGIVMRLPALEERRRLGDRSAVTTALAAHLCRCTGWQTITEAAADLAAGTSVSEPDGPPVLGAWRASIEGGQPQHGGRHVVMGQGGFADDRAPRQAVVGVPAPGEGAPGPVLVVGPSLSSARRAAARPPGRRSTASLRHPVAVPEGDWALTLQTTWVDPAYLEPDASWCRPGGRPASPLGNGGAFGGKAESKAPCAAAGLADEEGAAARVVWSRDDVVRFAPKRPPLAAGLRPDGTGTVVVGITAGSQDLSSVVAGLEASLPAASVELEEIEGPPVSGALRAAGWAEGQVLAAALAAGSSPLPAVAVTAPGGGSAVVTLADDAVSVRVDAGSPLDQVTLRSYVIGAVHQGLSWVRSEGLAVDDDGVPLDLTLRSLGILSAREMPRVEVEVAGSDHWPVKVSDAVFAATAAVAWLADGLVPEWPTRRRSGGRR